MKAVATRPGPSNDGPRGSRFVALVLVSFDTEHDGVLLACAKFFGERRARRLAPSQYGRRGLALASQVRGLASAVLRATLARAAYDLFGGPAHA